ncbi:hypothetical protein F383_36326 [Gossypium arboreum]|uniref:Uncharacterized protein n=1 Tax=Gossypium arboreum TaxID=29729 RepID=A0A0B0N8S8_GOSAR|nr:hypothetical protein F383_36326 [Gossypium arboreum]
MPLAQTGSYSHT